MRRGRTGIREAYRDETVARRYVDERFREPLGALLHARQSAALARAIDRLSPRRVLEVAPGPARLTVDVARRVAGGTMVDSSAQMLAEARRRLGGRARAWRIVQADAFHLPFRQAFDLVYTFRFLRHFESADRRRLYAELRRVLVPGGRLVFDAVNEVVSGPIRARARPGEYQHYDALLDPNTLHEELTSCGLVLERLEGAQHRYGLLYRTQVLVAPRSRPLARALMEGIDRFGGGEPLEWIVTCYRP